MVTTALLIGEMLTGRIRVTLDGPELPTSLRWTDELNKAGSIDGVNIPEALVRKYDLRHATDGMRCFLAVEVDGRIKQAGPVTARAWDAASGTLTLGARGMWAYLDSRLVFQAPLVAPYSSSVFAVTGKSLGGIGRALVANALLEPYGNVPIVLPADESGDHTETFPLYALLDVGEQLRQLTQRAVDAPDIAFRARRTAADPRFIEWVMLVGTEAQPAICQAGDDWIFDWSAPRSAVLGINTDEDPSQMAESVFVSGEGQEESTPLVNRFDTSLLTSTSPWPITWAKELRSQVADLGALGGHADSLLQRVNRPIEVYKVRIRSAQFNEVGAGDYARIIARDDAWLGDLDVRTRVRSVSGDISDEITVEMFSTKAALS